MAVSATSFLALVSRYLMSFSFFTTWHIEVVINVSSPDHQWLFVGQNGLLLFYFHISLNSFYENFRRLKSWDVVCRNLNGCVFRNVSSSFFGSCFDNKTTETT